jgi:iron(III) transport system substrate-binding protein
MGYARQKKYNLPFGYVFPKNGTVVLTDGIAIVKGTKSAALAKDFYEFVTSKQSLLIQAEKYYRVPSRTDIAKSELPEWLRNSDYKTLDVDWEVVAAKEADWMEKWDSGIKTSK